MADLGTSVSVIIPAHNEAPTIGDVAQACMANTPGLLEVIVVDDGSTDGTAEVAAAAGADVVRLPRNQGKGVALQRGIDHARGEILIFIDADGQDDPTEIPAMLAAFEPGVDIVLGSRFMGRFRPGAITRLNHLGTRFITTVVNLLFGIHVTDPLAGFRAVRANVFQFVRIEARGYDIEVDVLLRIVRLGGGVREVPAQRSARPHGQSGLSNVRDGTLILLRALSIRLAAQPKRSQVSPEFAIDPVAKPRSSADRH